MVGTDHLSPTPRTCPKSAREGRYLLTCCRPENHAGDCWCNNIREVDQ